LLASPGFRPCLAGHAPGGGGGGGGGLQRRRRSMPVRREARE